MNGGTSTGRVITDQCIAVDAPVGQSGTLSATSRQFCRVENPFRTQLKGFVIVPLPWGIRTSSGFQIVPGPQITAEYTPTNAEVRATLGRNFSGSTPTIALVRPGTQFTPALKSIDFRASKRVQLGRTRANASIDVFNVLNRSDVNTLSTSYTSASWLVPTQILVPRYAKVGIELDF